MKGTERKANAKIVLIVEVILIVSIILLFRCVGMDGDIRRGIFIASSLVIIIPTAFFGILSLTSKKDILFYIGTIAFLGSYGCFLQGLISLRPFALMVIASFLIAVIPLFLKTPLKSDTNSVNNEVKVDD